MSSPKKPSETTLEKRAMIQRLKQRSPLTRRSVQMRLLKGVRLIPSFGHETSIAIDERLRHGVYRLVSDKVITPSQQNVFLSFLGVQTLEREPLATYRPALNVIRSTILQSRDNERMEREKRKEHKPTPATPQEVAFELGRFSLDMAAQQEYFDEVAPQGSGFRWLLEGLNPRTQTTIRACAGYALSRLMGDTPDR